MAMPLPVEDLGHQRNVSNASNDSADQHSREVNISDDSPEFWKYVTSVRSKGEMLAEAALETAEMLQKRFTGGGDANIQLNNDGWSLYRKYLSLAGVKEYEKFAGLMSSLGGIRTIMEKDVTSKFIAPMSAWSERELHQLNHSKKAYDCLNDPYLSGVKKFLQTKLDSATPEQLSKERKKLQVQKQFLDITRFDVKSKACAVDEAIHINSLRPLYECLSAHWDYFYSGYNLMVRFKDKIDELKTHIEAKEEEQKLKAVVRRKQRRQLEKLTAARAEAANSESQSSLASVPQGNGIRDLDERRPAPDMVKSLMNGYLWVTTGGSGSGMSLSLTRAWCVVEPERISISVPCQPTLVMNLLLCTVKEGRELSLQYCFQIISPNRQLTMQALSKAEMHAWMDCIQSGILHTLNMQSGSKVAQESDMVAQIDALVGVAGNNACADCGSPDPDWISKNLGIVICKDCSGIHRSLGVHISKVRSLKLDKLDDSLVKFMQAVGNQNSNAIWLSSLPASVSPPGPDASRAAKKAWISEKYSGKLMERPSWTHEALNQAMFDAIHHRDLFEGLRLIALGIDVNYVNPAEEMRTPLHQAVDKCRVEFVEMLIQNNASMNAVEARGWSPLHYAAYRDSVEIVALLLSRGAEILQTDHQNADALALAVEYECVEAEPVLREAHTRETQKRARSREDLGGVDAGRQANTAGGNGASANDDKPNSMSLRKRLGTLFRRDRQAMSSASSSEAADASSRPRSPHDSMLL